ncbi:MAG: cell division protein ZapA [Pseudomonas sp.]
MSDIQIISLLGQDYSFRIAADEAVLFQQAADLLQQKLAETKARHNGSGHTELLVATALSLCVPLVQRTGELQAAEKRLTAMVDVLEAQRLDNQDDANPAC